MIGLWNFMLNKGKNVGEIEIEYSNAFEILSSLQHFSLMMSSFLLKLLHYADGNTMYVSQKSANIVINRLRHDFLLIMSE